MSQSSPKDQVTQQERRQLKLFVELVYEMVASRFIKAIPSLDHTIRSTANAEGGYDVIGPAYDMEDFRSFLTIYRKIAISSDEPTFLPKIRKIIGRYADESLRDQLGDFKQAIQPRLDGRISYFRLGGDATGRSYTSTELLDIIVNGMVFHSDEQHEAAKQFVQGLEIWKYMLIIWPETIQPVVRGCAWLVSVIRGNEYLEVDEMPPVAES